jgi:hypothetical protein
MLLAEWVRSWLQPFRSQAQPEDVFRSLWVKTARAAIADIDAAAEAAASVEITTRASPHGDLVSANGR